MIHIEFSGVPGSGKTFFCSLLAEKLRLQGIPVITNPHNLAESSLVIRMIRKSGTIGIQMLLHPVWTSCIFYIILTTRQSSIKGILRSFFTIVHVTGTIRKYKNGNCCLLLDQGTIQAFFSLLYGARSIPGETIEHLIPVPDILLETDGPDSLLISRLGARVRSQSRIESEGKPGIDHSRSILGLIRHRSLYKKIPLKITVPDERSEQVLFDITEQIHKRILHDTEE